MTISDKEVTKMGVSKEVYQACVDILHEELRPAMGCTEPIAVAYAGALARKTLGMMPDRVELVVSGNIIKNVKSVIVPNTGGQRGLRTAVAVGIVAGNADKELEVIADVDEAGIEAMLAFRDDKDISIVRSTANIPFDIQVKVWKDEDSAYVRIVATHTNVVRIEKNGEVLLSKEYSEEAAEPPANRGLLTVENIVNFADEVNIEDVKDVLDRQIEYNMAIAEEGMKHNYGANIGKIITLSQHNNVWNQAKAYAAAGSDARMNGCDMPVVINSGSGNQGITSSVPVIVYARAMEATQEDLYRALCVSNLITIHLKTGIGSLSAYCGATSAGVGAGAGVCYLFGGKYEEVSHTVINALAINSGMICDGAKASCAAKITSAVEAGLLSWSMGKSHSYFYDGDGIVIKGVENTIAAVSKIARDGMKSTDAEIIQLMIDN